MLPVDETSQDDGDSLTDVSLLVESNSTTNNEDQTMVQTLITYANSFNLDGTVCTVQDLKNQLDSIHSTKRKSMFSSARKAEDDNSDENTTVTDGSKFQWENVSESKIHQMKSPIIVCEVLTDRPSPPTLIIVREILGKSSVSTRTCFSLSTKPPIVPKRRRENHVRITTNKQSKNDPLNVSADQDIKQRVYPYEYVQRYGTSLYAQEIFRNLLTTVVL